MVDFPYIQALGRLAGCKQAADEQAADDSSYLGRYVGLHALQGQGDIESPWISSLLNGASGAARLVTGPIANRLELGKGTPGAERLQAMLDAAEKRKGHFGASFGHGAAQMAGPGALIGGLGGAVGGVMGAARGHGSGSQLAVSGLIGGLGGVVGGGVLGGLLGGTRGAVQEAILSRLRPSTKARLKQHLSRNPSLTGLPLGSVIGAGVA